MSNEGNEFDFKNEILSFKSNVNDFTKSIFNDLDSISKNIQLENFLYLCVQFQYIQELQIL